MSSAFTFEGSNLVALGLGVAVPEGGREAVKPQPKVREEEETIPQSFPSGPFPNNPKAAS